MAPAVRTCDDPFRRCLCFDSFLCQQVVQCVVASPDSFSVVCACGMPGWVRITGGTPASVVIQRTNLSTNPLW